MISIKKLFDRLCGLELKLLDYIYRKQGKSAASVDFSEAAKELGVDKNAIRRASKRLVEAKVLLVTGEEFKIDEEIIKDADNVGAAPKQDLN